MVLCSVLRDISESIVALLTKEGNYVRSQFYVDLVVNVTVDDFYLLH